MQQRTTPTTTARNPQILLGRYRILEVNSEGGFGTVNVCWDSRLQRRVAIKRMPLQLGADPNVHASTIDEALSEARTSSMLAHPNIVTMFDFEKDERYSYLVMEYVDGLNLADLLARVEGGVLTFDECAHLVDSLASALAYAHENGVLHLDIKPANIMIDRSGTVKLGDFGMASLASAAGYGGARGGTVGYMPPEQISGDYVDERTDVFSLGVVVWQALTGQCPYAAPTPEKSLDRIMRGPSPALSRIEPELAGTVEETLLRALDPAPASRISSVDAFARHIVTALGDVRAGQESLRDLLNQTEADEEPRPVSDWGRLHVPLLIRFPWLPSACSRILAAATAAWVAHQTIPFILPESERALSFGTLGVAAATAAWPPLGGAFGLVALTGALLTRATSLSVLISLLVGLVGITWWTVVGRRSPLAGAALLAPTCLSSPMAGVGLAGFALEPGAAFLTGAGSILMLLVCSLAMGSGFDAEMLADGLRLAALQPQTWAVTLLGGFGSMACALLARLGRVGLGILGQALAIGAATIAFVVSQRMENVGSALHVDAQALGVAVFFGVTLCIASAIAGPNTRQQEGDGRA